MIIIDDLSVFLSIGFTYVQILALISNLKNVLKGTGHYLVVGSHSGEKLVH